MHLQKVMKYKMYVSLFLLQKETNLKQKYQVHFLKFLIITCKNSQIMPEPNVSH